MQTSQLLCNCASVINRYEYSSKNWIPSLLLLETTAMKTAMRLLYARCGCWDRIVT